MPRRTLSLNPRLNPGTCFRRVRAGRLRVSRVAFALVVGLAWLVSWQGAGATEAAAKPGIAWQDWSADLFEQARAENRFVLLDLGAVWCHWCHVMEQKTYTDPQVIRLIREHYIPVRVDQDARPDLSVRYERYGWPATIIFGPDGTEIVKRRGFIRADILASILDAVVEDPSPVPGIQVELPATYAESGQLAEPIRAELVERHAKALDTERGGLNVAYRYLPWEAVEYVLGRVRSGDRAQEAWLRKTLSASRALIDPVFGGVYQYSVKRRWDEPHFEKIMSFQAENLRIYTLAHAQLGDPAMRKAADDIVRYVDEFLTDESGAFYTSQDADLVPGTHAGDYFALDRKAREALGIPRVDTHRYARENGWMIEALATMYELTGDTAALRRATRAARWVLAERALDGGGFRHDRAGPAGPFLGDTLAMGRACLALYRGTSERSWLSCAQAAAGFIERQFRRKNAGYLSASSATSAVEPLPQFDENIRLARFTNLLAHYTGDSAFHEMAEHALRFATTREIHARRTEIAGLLLADSELRTDPVHLTVVGSRGDPTAVTLYAAALREPVWYKRVEWWDPAEGPLPNPDVTYPVAMAPAAFVCTDQACSAPIRDPGDIPAFLARTVRESAGE